MRLLTDTDIADVGGGQSAGSAVRAIVEGIVAAFAYDTLKDLKGGESAWTTYDAMGNPTS